MNNQENKPLKNNTDQELLEQLIEEINRRYKVNPTEFIPKLKIVLPFLQLLIGEKPNLKDFSDQELMKEAARRIENFSLDLNSLVYPFLVVASQYIQSYEAKRIKLNLEK